uniref:Uncharacterized protein n=1 Tax=Neobodo designis TaxID=312471 RepID=A0A7S1W461_NEODS
MPDGKRRFRWRWWRKEENPREPTADGAARAGPVSTGEMLTKTMEVQQESILVIAEMERDLGVADEQAIAAAERLARSREVMNRAESEAVQAAPAQQQVEAQTESMARKVYRDKCCMVLTSIVVLLLIAVIIVEFGVETDDGPSAVPAPGNTSAPTNSTNSTI